VNNLPAAAALGTPVSAVAGTVALGGTSASASFTRRQVNSLSYWTPVFGGFSGGFQFSDTREGLLQNNATVPKKPRMWDIGVQYVNGPLMLGAGYQRHENYNPANMLPAGNSAQVAGAAAPTYIDGRDRAWDLGAAYTFAGVFKLSAIYSNNEYNMNFINGGLGSGGASGNLTLSQRSWGIFGDWAVAGPHRLRAEYVKANSTGGNFVGTVGNWVGNGGAGNTGATLYSLQYAYAFSKRTELNFGYSKIDNDTAAGYRLQTLAQTNVGQNQNAWVLGAKHTF
jgi:hypothetical protein